MLIGQRLRQLREEMNLSQGDIERSTGLFRCYVSRVENEHTVPTVETLEKWARALEIPLYQLFYEGKSPAKPPQLPRLKEDKLWGNSGRNARALHRFRSFLSRMNKDSRDLLMSVAGRMARPTRKK
jgi:transcriptional regulator with XRE-family HTH domain